tara:strand:+ start:11564 stop:13348 length:1785 start_codon:yes stop_codon:yes gene_type:complete
MNLISCRFRKLIWHLIPGLYQVIFIFKRLPRKIKLNIVFLIFLILLTSFLEFNFLIIFGEFISNITGDNNQNPISVFSLFLSSIIKKEVSKDLFWLSILLSISVCLSSFFRIFYIRKNSMVAADLESYLGTKYFSNIIRNDYSYFVDNSSENILSALANHVPASGSAIRSFFQFIGSFILSLGIIIALLKLQFTLTIITSILFIFLYGLIAICSQKIILNASKVIVKTTASRIRVAQQGIGGIRDIILDSSQKYLENEFYSNSKQELKTKALQQFLSLSPRFLLEAFAICIFSFFALISILSERPIISSLAVLALGAQRLLPSINLLFNGWMGIVGASESLKIVSNGLSYERKINSEKNTKNIHKVKFENSISLKNIHFKYPKGKFNILENVSIEIKKGQNIGIVGSTGVGKSTLTDIILGLVKPSLGSIYIDNKILDSKKRLDWNRQISHVPQTIYLSNASIAENIAFCKSGKKYSIDLIRKVAKVSCLEEYINSLENSYETIIGEGGIKMSGGQRQRLAIARALYKLPSLIILDEATSALDDFTQEKVMQSIKKFLTETTIIQITHRKNNLRFCDKVYILKDASLSAYKFIP